MIFLKMAFGRSHSSTYDQEFYCFILIILSFHLCNTIEDRIKRQYNIGYRGEGDSDRGGTSNFDLNSNYPGHNSNGNEYDSNAQGDERYHYYNPQYRYNSDRYKVKEYNPYEFNPISQSYRTRRQKEYNTARPIPPVEVKTALGRVVGYPVFLYDGPKVPLENRPNENVFDTVYRNVTVFKGIPYAEPPVEEQRFEYPRPYSRNWGSIDARYYGPACPQANEYIGASKGNLHVNEDCLYLNIFTPSAYKGARHSFPVMIYIHGGFFNHGSANRFPAHMLSASMEVIVVTFNYRLGVLGFLSTGDEASPGNYGLLDQSLAIQWVHSHIESFNGDPTKITLFGPGAGAASAGLHAVSPRSKNYFHRIIAQSGSMLAEWAVTLDPEFSRNTTKLYGEKVGCSSSSSFGLVTCLKNRKPAELVNANFEPMVGWLAWAPVVDWYTQHEEYRFLEDSPEKLIERNYLNKNIDYMCGLTVDEASKFVVEDKKLRYKGYEIDKAQLDKRIRKFIEMYNYTLNPEGVFNAIQFMYTPWSDENNKTLIRDGYIQVLTDSYFVAPTMKLNKLLLGKQFTPYMYVLNTTVQSLKKPQWEGVPHDNEYFYITGAPFMDPEFFPSEYNLKDVKWTDRDRNMSEFFMNTWTNFVKFGDPNRPTNSFNIRWNPMEFGNMQYLSLNTTNDTYSTMQRDYKERESAFWTEYIPQLIGRILPTYAPTLEPWYEERRVIRTALWGTVASGALFFILMIVGCGLYCSKKRNSHYHDEQLPNYNTPYIVGSEQKKYFGEEVTVNHNAIKKEQQTSV